MSQILTTSTGKQIALLSRRELDDGGRVIAPGKKLRAFCPIHGSDHQRSLSIDPASGWGQCYACGMRVVVEEFNPRLAQELRERWGTTLSEQGQHPTVLRSRGTRPQPPGNQEQEAATRPSWQQEEYRALSRIQPQMREAFVSYRWGDSWQAQAYLHFRGIPLDVAARTEVGYLPQTLLDLTESHASRSSLQRWSERLLFPLYSPEGNGFIGRSIWRWQLGMEESVHKALLEDLPGAPRRWLKTRPAGWVSIRPVLLASCIIVVEGPFDRLALLAGGFADDEVIALAGTTVNEEWFPSHIKGVLLALDNDGAGQQAMQRLSRSLQHAGIVVQVCPPPLDGMGKDWSQRWRRTQSPDGLEKLYQAYSVLGEHLPPQEPERG